MSFSKLPKKLKSLFQKQIEKQNHLDKNAKEIIIIVMGATGAGKSTFINEVTGKASMVVGHDIESCTSAINTVRIDDFQLLSEFAWLEDRSVILVDTPGFDDTYKEDVEILELIARWLVESYSSRMLAGVVYLHDISLDRYTGTSKKNLRMFQRLCGHKALDMVTIGATKAQKFGDICVAQRRFDQLKSNHWKDMIDEGARATLLDVDGHGSKQVVLELLKRFGKNFGNASLQTKGGATIIPTAVTRGNPQSQSKDEPMASVNDGLPLPPHPSKSFSPVHERSEAPLSSNAGGDPSSSHTVEKEDAKLPLSSELSEPLQNTVDTGNIKQILALAIQHELVDKNLIVPETSAGQELRYTLRQILEYQERMAQLSKGTKKGDHEDEAELEEARKEIEALTNQLQKLKVPLGRRLRGLLHLK